MTPIPRLICLALTCIAVVPVTFAAEDSHPERLNREFQSAVGQYESGHAAEAASRLEVLLREAPESFEIHELLGMAYSAQSLDSKASAHLARAVELKPNAVEARTNYATNLVRLGKAQTAEVQFKKALELAPTSYDTNHNLGEFYIQTGRLPEAAPLLQKAQDISPSSYDNGYDLSLAYLKLGRAADAQRTATGLLKIKDTAELHNLLGQIEEADGNFIAAANEFQAAAHMDPSESNLFDWGSELLMHRTLDPAVEVFQKAVERYPKSARLAVGLGMTLYSRGNYDDAVKALLNAADLNPSDPNCYYFLSRAYDSSPTQAEAVIQRFRRFAELQPQNARSHYYYAMSLWKGRRVQDVNLDKAQIESLLKKAIELDPKLAEAHLQLGNWYSDQGQNAAAIPEYERAVQLNSGLADAHYRLGQAYVRTGQKQRAQEQLQVYQRLRAEHLAELDKQKSEIRQFVYSERSGEKQ